MRASGRAGHSTRLGLVHALMINWAPRLLSMQCPEFLTDCVIAFVQHGLPEQRVKPFSGGLQSELPLPSAGTGIAKSFRPGLFDQDIVRF